MYTQSISAYSWSLWRWSGVKSCYLTSIWRPTWKHLILISLPPTLANWSSTSWRGKQRCLPSICPSKSDQIWSSLESRSRIVQSLCPEMTWKIPSLGSGLLRIRILTEFYALFGKKKEWESVCQIECLHCLQTDRRSTGHRYHHSFSRHHRFPSGPSNSSLQVDVQTRRLDTDNSKLNVTDLSHKLAATIKLGPRIPARQHWNTRESKFKWLHKLFLRFPCRCWLLPNHFIHQSGAQIISRLKTTLNDHWRSAYPGDHVFDIYTGSDFNSDLAAAPTSNSRTIRVRDLKTNVLYSIPLIDDSYYNFAVAVDWDEKWGLQTEFYPTCKTHFSDPLDPFFWRANAYPALCRYTRPRVMMIFNWSLARSQTTQRLWLLRMFRRENGTSNWSSCT